MERLKWTDDLIDERMATIDDKFDRLFSEIHALRNEMNAGFAELRAEMVSLRRDVHADHVALHRHVNLIVAGFAVALLGLLGAGAVLAVNQPAVRRPGGFHHRFGERRVRVDGAGHLWVAALELARVH